MGRIVIALSGWKGSGKDTAADYLVSRHAFTKASFAAALKDKVASDYRIERDILDSDKKEMPLHQFPAIPSDPFSEKVHEMLSHELRSGYWTPRALCILEGSMKRAAYSNYWIRTIAREIISNSSRNYVISDMRYQTEADTLKLLIPDIQLIRVHRYKEIDTTEASERNLDDYPFNLYLYNDHTLEQLHTNIDILLENLA